MENTLFQLYSGEIYPEEQYIPKLESYKRMRKRHGQQQEQFYKELAALDEKLGKEFLEILSTQGETAPFETRQMFVDGFRLGARIMLAVCQDDNSTP